MNFKQWEGFNPLGEWTKEIDVRGFIQANYTPYDGDDSFLKKPTERTKKLLKQQKNLVNLMDTKQMKKLTTFTII